ncbi:hypothetical protein RCL1_004926 [Eukaryota sp. TZLM3-RCL]
MPSITEILSKTKNIDRDFRIIGLSELQKLAETASRNLDYPNDITTALIDLTLDPISDVRTVCIRTVPSVIPILPDDNVVQLSNKMISEITSPESTQDKSDAAALCLRSISTVVSKMDHRRESLISRFISLLLTIPSKNPNLSSARISSLECLGIILPAINPTIITRHNESDLPSLTSLLLSSIKHESSIIRKSSVSCLGSICSILPPSSKQLVLKDLISSLPDLSSSSSNLPVLRSVFLAASTAIKEIQQESTGYILQFISKSIILIDFLIENDPLSQEVHDAVEAALGLFETIFTCFTSKSFIESKELIEQLINLLNKLLKFDPNAISIEVPNQMESGHDFDDEFGDFADFEEFEPENNQNDLIFDLEVDSSVKVRRASSRVFTSMVSNAVSNSFVHLISFIINQSVKSVENERIPLALIDLYELIKSLISSFSRFFSEEEIISLFTHLSNLIEGFKNSATNSTLENSVFELSSLLVEIFPDFISQDQSRISQISLFISYAVNSVSAQSSSQSTVQFSNRVLPISLFSFVKSCIEKLNNVLDTIIFENIVQSFCSALNPLHSQSIKSLPFILDCLVSISKLEMIEDLNSELLLLLVNTGLFLLDSTEVEQTVKIPCLDLLSEISVKNFELFSSMIFKFLLVHASRTTLITSLYCLRHLDKIFERIDVSKLSIDDVSVLIGHALSHLKMITLPNQQAAMSLISKILSAFPSIAVKIESEIKEFIISIIRESGVNNPLSFLIFELAQYYARDQSIQELCFEAIKFDITSSSLSKLLINISRIDNNPIKLINHIISHNLKLESPSISLANHVGFLILSYINDPSFGECLSIIISLLKQSLENKSVSYATITTWFYSLAVVAQNHDLSGLLIGENNLLSSTFLRITETRSGAASLIGALMCSSPDFTMNWAEINLFQDKTNIPLQSVFLSSVSVALSLRCTTILNWTSWIVELVLKELENGTDSILITSISDVLSKIVRLSPTLVSDVLNEIWMNYSTNQSKQQENVLRALFDSIGPSFSEISEPLSSIKSPLPLASRDEVFEIFSNNLFQIFPIISGLISQSKISIEIFEAFYNSLTSLCHYNPKIFSENLNSEMIKQMIEQLVLNSWKMFQKDINAGPFTVKLDSHLPIRRDVLMIFSELISRDLIVSDLVKEILFTVVKESFIDSFDVVTIAFSIFKSIANDSRYYDEIVSKIGPYASYSLYLLFDKERKTQNKTDSPDQIQKKQSLLKEAAELFKILTVFPGLSQSDNIKKLTTILKSKDFAELTKF